MDDTDLLSTDSHPLPLTNSCVDVVEWLVTNYDDLTAHKSIRILFAFVYSSTLLIGLLGNLLVVASVWRHRVLQTVRNLFIVSLSCSDIVVCLTSLPITPLTFTLKNWLFGSFLCYAFPLFQGMSVCISTFTLTAVAVDRYILIVFPTRTPIQRGHALTMIISIWALAAGVSLPMVVHYNHFHGPDKTSGSIDHVIGSNETLFSAIDENDQNDGLPIFCGYFCEEVWPSERIKQLYGSFVMTLQFLVPMTIISFCYIHICIRLSARNESRPRIGRTAPMVAPQSIVNDSVRAPLTRMGTVDLSTGLNACSTTSTAVSSPSVAEHRRRAVLKRQKRTNRMLIAMVVIFGLCWAPNVLMNILRDLESLPSIVNDQMYLFYLICHSIAMTSTIWNPLLYSWMNETFRRAMTRALVELVPCSRIINRKWSSRRRRIECGLSANYNELGSQLAMNLDQSLVPTALFSEKNGERRRSSGAVKMNQQHAVQNERKPLLKRIASRPGALKRACKDNENNGTTVTGNIKIPHEILTHL